MRTLLLTIGRDIVTGVAPDGTPFTVLPTLGLIRENGTPKIFVVGATDTDFRASLSEADQRTGTPATIVALPGEDAWWDAVMRWPRLSVEEEAAARLLPSRASVLFVSPLHHEGWSPFLTAGLFRYVRARHAPGSLSLDIVGLGPTIIATLSRDAAFSDLERAEIFDALSSGSPRSRVVIAPGVPRAELSSSACRLRTLHRLMNAVLICFALTSFFVLRVGPRAFGMRVLVPVLFLAPMLPLRRRIDRLQQAVDREAVRRRATQPVD
jgi:hypothetical protein